MQSEAKNFKGGTYPLDGPRLGPAWRDVWRSLQPNRWKSTDDLAVIGARHGLARKTVYNLLWSAQRAGQVSSRRRGRVTEWRGKLTA